MKKGSFALSNVMALLLVLLGLLVTVLLIYYLRDQLKEMAEMILGVLKL